MNVDKFSTKLNKISNHVYTIEEEIVITTGNYKGILEHDNANLKTVNVYTGKKLTGEKIENVLLSTPSETPWKTIIEVFTNPDITNAYITYQTPGDTIEADDINFIQDSVVKTQEEFNTYEEKTDDEIVKLKKRSTSLEENKVDKVQGKQLSTNDYTNAEKNKLAGVEDNANHYVHPNNHDDRYYTETESDSRYLRTNVKNLGSSDDFDNILDFGLYRVGSATPMTNAPYTGGIYGILEVFQFTSTTETVQIFTDFKNNMYTRFKGSGSGWTYWSKYFSSINKPTWEDVTNKPDTFTPSEHNHDDRYYTDTQSRNLFVGKKPTRIESGNLNEITTGGNYIVASNSVLNSPKGFGRLSVLQWDTSDKWITQIFYSDLGNEMYIRCSTNTTATNWTSWSKVYSQNTKPKWIDIEERPTIPTKFSQLENDIGIGGLPSKFTWSMLRGY